MTYDFLTALLGIALLIAGGDVMVRGAASLAARLGVSPLAVGLTVVAFGTSAPELAVNVTAAWRGNGEISFGNIIGSNMANIGLIVAVAALVRPIQVKSVVISREVPMMILATAAVCVFGLDELISGHTGLFERGDGLVLLLLFTVFVYYTMNDVIQQRQAKAIADEKHTVPSVRTRRVSASLLLVGLGLALLVFGAQLTVDGALGLAEAFGVSKAIIGLTLVAVGTSLPELAASVVATWKGHSDIAIGNVVGSNIFNLLLVLGTSAAIRPIPVPPGGVGDLFLVSILSLLLLGTSMSRGNRIIRTEAGMLLAVYLVYIVARSGGWLG